jgi:hypothetical protein
MAEEYTPQRRRLPLLMMPKLCRLLFDKMKCQFLLMARSILYGMFVPVGLLMEN